jgi:hypothetical protein
MNELQMGVPLIEFINATGSSPNYQGPPNTDYIDNPDGTRTWFVSDSETIQRMSEMYRQLGIKGNTDNRNSEG